VTTSPAPAIELTGVTKRFGDRVAVDSLDLHVPTGVFYGIVGPNGAGKSTTLSMIAGLLAPDEGTVAVLGHDIRIDREHVLDSLGLMLEGLSLPERLTGAELLQYTARLRRLDAGWDARANDLLEILGLDRSPSTLIVDYSTGMRKKIGLAVALLHRPRILVLDEPLEAIDPVSALAIEGLLDQYIVGGGTVLLSSHSMDAVERLCSHVALVTDGRVVAAGALEDVSAGRTLIETFVETIGAPPLRTVEWLG
jgi:ABC-2 type transport system ATP-binding protein